MTLAATADRPHPPADDLSDLIAKYDGRAPRYTSYPTAVQFGPAVTAGAYETWLGQLPTDRPVSLYLHIPFCAQLCWYCGCNTRAVHRRSTIGEYVKLLVAEIGLVRAALPARLTADAIHFGGGTPNMLWPDELSSLFAALGQGFAFAPGLEVAAELDPAALNREWVQAATAHGLNRASLGVQNLDPAVQKAVNRHDTIDDIRRCVGWLREAGVGSVNLDLMYGLPRQTTENTLQTLDQVLRLRPERIALFGYAHVPWMKTHQKLIDEATLPGPAERLDQSESAARRLVSEGYRRIGLDHFALPDDTLAIAQAAGRLHRNFQGYTTDEATTLLGVGVSAIGHLPQGFVQNQSQEVLWRAEISQGRLPVARGVAVTDEDRFRGEIIERLMCDFAVDLGAICRRHGRSVLSLAPELEGLKSFVADGLLRIDGARIEATPRGRLLIRSIAALFDVYFAADSGRHAKAI
jgi:oxygen-independent coproporphyrinogen-3 oxidase